MKKFKKETVQLENSAVQEVKKMGFTVKAMVHSLNELTDVTIISENGCNNVVAEYNGKKYTAVYNGFVCRYYVDDIYGKIN